MAWKHTSENKESRIQKDVNEYLKRKTGEQDRIVMKQQAAKKHSDNFVAQSKKLKEKYETKMTNNAIVDHNKQHKGTFNEIKSKVAKKMEHVSSTQLEAMERAYKNQGRSVPLRYKVKK